jgi:ATP-dependent Clp protease ATP-binding subunit ClpA
MEGCYFTPRAQKVLALSREEAARFNHNFIGTEHLLLGLISLGQGTAVNVLAEIGLQLETVRAEVEKQVGTGPDQKIIGYIPYTPRVKRVLALTAKEAKALNHTYVGTEHILLGLLLDGEGVAARVFKTLGVDTQKTRQLILSELNPNYSPMSTEEREIRASPSGAGGHVEPQLIETTHRYDVYCAERNEEVVYRNALFKGVRKLLPQKEYDFLSDFLELELSDGRVIFVSRNSVMKFCPHEAETSSDTGSAHQP